MIQNKDILRSYFLTGAIPTQQNFADLIDTIVNLTEEDQIVTYASGNVGIKEDPDTDPGYDFSVAGNMRVTGNLVMENASVTDTINIKNGNVDHLGGFSDLPNGTTDIGSGNGSIDIVGTDLAGKITIETGTGCSANSNIFSLEFASSYAASPNVLITPGNKKAADIFTSSMPFVDFTDETKFDVAANDIALDDNTIYIFRYFVIA